MREWGRVRYRQAMSDYDLRQFIERLESERRLRQERFEEQVGLWLLVLTAIVVVGFVVLFVRMG